MPARQYWLVKSEPETFSFDDLLAAPGERRTGTVCVISQRATIFAR